MHTHRFNYRERRGAMKAFLASLITLSIVVIIGVYWLAPRFGTSKFVPVPVEQRQPFEHDLVLPALKGGTFRLAALRGQVVLLNVWGVWCYPCRAEMPAMAALYRRYETDSGFAVVAVANDPEGREIVEPFVEKHDLPFLILLDAKNTLWTQLELLGVPTSYLLDRQGRIALREVGQRDWNHPDMHRLVDELLAEPSGS
jgi:peroxiredoxin